MATNMRYNYTILAYNSDLVAECECPQTKERKTQSTYTQGINKKVIISLFYFWFQIKTNGCLGSDTD